MNETDATSTPTNTHEYIQVASDFVAEHEVWLLRRVVVVAWVFGLCAWLLLCCCCWSVYTKHTYGRHLTHAPQPPPPHDRPASTRTSGALLLAQRR